MSIDAPVSTIQVTGTSFILILALGAFPSSVFGFNVNKCSSSLLLSSLALLKVRTDWCVFDAASCLGLLRQTAAQWLSFPLFEHTFPLAEHWLFLCGHCLPQCPQVFDLGCVEGLCCCLFGWPF